MKDYQTSTVDGAEAFERARARAEDHAYFDRVTEADCYEENPNSGDWMQTLGEVTFHTARKDHQDGQIKKGQRYAKVTAGGYVVDGAQWFKSYKVVMKEGQKLQDWHHHWAMYRGLVQEESEEY